MATSFTGTGNWNDAARWSGGVPDATQAVTIASGTCTLNVNTAAALSVTISAGATLIAAVGADTKLVVQNGFVNNGTCTLDVSSDPTKSCQLLLNNANGALGTTTQLSLVRGAPFTFKGAARTRWTKISGAVSAGAHQATAVAATGWRNGDVIVFATTDAYASPPHVDVLTLGTNGGDTYTNGSTSLCFTGNFSYAHAAGCYVGNLSSNLILAPANGGNVATDGRPFCIQYNRGYASDGGTKVFQDAQIQGLNGGYTNESTYGLTLCGNDLYILDSTLLVINNNSFYDFRDHNSSGIGGGLFFRYWLGPTAARTNNIYYTANGGSPQVQYSGAISGTSSINGGDVNAIVFRAPQGVLTNASGYSFSGAISGIPANGYAIDNEGAAGMDMSNTHIWSCDKGILSNGSIVSGSSVTIGAAFTNVAVNTPFVNGALGETTLTDSTMQAGSVSPTNQAYTSDISFLTLINKNSDVTLQEIYRPYCEIKRSNATINRSTSSVSIKPTRTATDSQYAVTIPCANGATIRVVGYCKADANFYNGGGAGWTAPTVTLGGTIAGTTLTTATYTASAAANNAFEQINDGSGNLYLSCTNTSGSDGNLTLTFTANAKSVTTGTVYFDGIPTNSPFVTKARHYGYQFDQTLPQVTVNSVVSANEATAAAYTGMTVTGGATTSPVALTADQTFQKLYDYTQAWSCLNLGYAVPVIGSAPGSFLAAGNLTTDGYTLNGAGSINTGTYTLHATVPWTYSYTNGTFSQLSTVPSFSGGTLTIGAEGTYTFTMASSTKVVVTPSADNVHYVFASGSFTGTLTVNNANAHPCVIEVPAGTTTSSAGNTGGAITFTAPAVARGIAFTGLIAGSQVKVFDTGTTTEEFSTNASGASETWSEAVAGSRTVDYTVMKAGYLPVRVTGVVVTGATSGGVLATPIQQVVDRAYVASGSIAWGNVTVNTGTKRFTLSVNSTVQNFYSFMVESWIAQATLKNQLFPLTNNGPNSFSLNDWEWATVRPASRTCRATACAMLVLERRRRYGRHCSLLGFRLASRFATHRQMAARQVTQRLLETLTN